MKNKGLIKKIKKFYHNINSIEDHRYKSWEHCYKYFRKVRKKDVLKKNELDLAQLHLAFYLASWGMYRGSSFLLQKDYTVFEKIINEILLKKYSILWDIEDHLSRKDEMKLLFDELYNNLQNILIKIKKSVGKHPDFENIEKRFINGNNQISPTLMTKIILGTIGCIPAYDRFLLIGLKSEGLQQQFNSKKSFGEMIKFYLKNKNEVDLLMREFRGYPTMKILDMYFWEAGFMESELKGVM